MKIYLASDHAGFELKEALEVFLRAAEYDVDDCGANAFVPTDDYPDIITKAAQALQKDIIEGHEAVGIILGGSGEGEAIVANRFEGIRATVYYGGNPDIIRLSKEHNDANVLSLGARFMSADEAKTAVRTWLETKFSGEERHARRLQALARIHGGQELHDTPR